MQQWREHEKVSTITAVPNYRLKFKKEFETLIASHRTNRNWYENAEKCDKDSQWTLSSLNSNTFQQVIMCKVFQQL